MQVLYNTRNQKAIQKEKKKITITSKMKKKLRIASLTRYLLALLWFFYFSWLRFYFFWKGDLALYLSISTLWQPVSQILYKDVSIRYQNIPCKFRNTFWPAFSEIYFRFPSYFLSFKKKLSKYWSLKKIWTNYEK